MAVPTCRLGILSLERAIGSAGLDEQQWSGKGRS